MPGISYYQSGLCMWSLVPFVLSEPCPVLHFQPLFQKAVEWGRLTLFLIRDVWGIRKLIPWPSSSRRLWFTSSPTWSFKPFPLQRDPLARGGYRTTQCNIKGKGSERESGGGKGGGEGKAFTDTVPCAITNIKIFTATWFFSHLRRQKSACVIYEKDMTNSSVILGWFVIYQWQQCAAISNCGLSKSEHYKNKYNTCFWEELSVSEARSWL